MSQAFIEKAGYKRFEFTKILSIYSKWNAKGLFKDLRFTDGGAFFYISFCEHAHAQPLITIHKEIPSAKRDLFIATTPGVRGAVIEIARSEKLDSFLTSLDTKIERLALAKKGDQNISLL